MGNNCIHLGKKEFILDERLKDDVELFLESSQKEFTEQIQNLAKTCKSLESSNSKISEILHKLDQKNTNSHDRISTLEASTEFIAKSLLKTTTDLAEIRDIIKTDKDLKKQSHKSVMKQLGYSSDRQLPQTVDDWIGIASFNIESMEFTPKMMLSMSKCINISHFTTVGLHLDLTENDIVQAEVAGKSTECAYQLLQKWRNKMGNMATMKSLLECFLNAVRVTAGSIHVEQLKEALTRIQNDDV